MTAGDDRYEIARHADDAQRVQFSLGYSNECEFSIILPEKKLTSCMSENPIDRRQLIRW